MLPLELNVSEELIRKIKALSVLKGSQALTEEYLVELLDTVVTNEIINTLNVLSPLKERSESQEAARPMTAAPSNRYYQDASEISDGLGDEYEDQESSEDEPVSNMYDLIPPKGGVSEKDLDRDMDVEDQEHEAKAEAMIPSNYSKPEEIFSNVLGVPLPSDLGEDYEEDPRVTRRKRKPKFKAKISPATGDE